MKYFRLILVSLWHQQSTILKTTDTPALTARCQSNFQRYRLWYIIQLKSGRIPNQLTQTKYHYVFNIHIKRTYRKVSKWVSLKILFSTHVEVEHGNFPFSYLVCQSIWLMLIFNTQSHVNVITRKLYSQYYNYVSRVYPLREVTASAQRQDWAQRATKNIDRDPINISQFSEKQQNKKCQSVKNQLRIVCST